MGKDKKIAIVTCCLDDWGGSEELWARILPILKDHGINHVTVYKNRINKDHPEFRVLASQNVILKELVPDLSFINKFFLKIADIFIRLGDKIGLLTYKWNKPIARLNRYLKNDRPDLVLISQGINFDGLAFANICLQQHIPYVIVSHKAVSFYWPQPGDRAYMKNVLLKAEKCFFVSEHNKKLTEEQFGIRLPTSELVFNPVKVPVSPLPFPDPSNGYRLACVGRLFVIDKGQDMLLRVLAQPKWKSRAITVSFIGKGPDLDGLAELSGLLGIEKVSFNGYQDDLKAIWSTHHALILPSRSEGMPLTIIEAMSLGRMVIATDAGGNTELIEDGVTGFIAEPNEKDLDEVLEAAWNRKEEWASMGTTAAEYISGRIPEHPERQFANLLNDILNAS